MIITLLVVALMFGYLGYVTSWFTIHLERCRWFWERWERIEWHDELPFEVGYQDLDFTETELMEALEDTPYTLWLKKRYAVKYVPYQDRVINNRGDSLMAEVEKIEEKRSRAKEADLYGKYLTNF